MLDDEIINIFYKMVNEEVKNGHVDCYFTINMAFNLVINNEVISKCDLDDKALIIPELHITDKELFDELLCTYVKRASEYYHPYNFHFLNDLDYMKIPNRDVLKKQYYIKYLICMLFANATLSDFLNPLAFLKNRINMFDEHVLPLDEEIYIGNIESIDAKLYAKEEVSPIKAESPSRIICYLEFPDGYTLKMPEIYYGCGEDNYTLYGIQKTSKNSEVDERPYLKQIRHGFIAKLNGAPEHYFLAVMLFLSLCRDKKIYVAPLLPERWNAKRMALALKAKRNNNYNEDVLDEEQTRIQTTLTDIFIRYFTKIEDVTEGVEITKVPFIDDANMHVQVADNIQSRCIAFNELFQLTNTIKKQRSK